MLRPLFASLCLLLLSTTLHAATVITTDTITSPDHFMGFEGLPDFLAFGATHTEDNILLEQINGGSLGILTALSKTGMEGSRAWYPNSGDNGYTKITRVGGGPIDSIGFLRASGIISPSPLLYELWNGGVLVQNGSISPHQNDPVLYLGFTGGGFDELRVRDSSTNATVLSDGSPNALWLDAIEIVNGVAAPVQAVPALPPLILLLLVLSIGLIGRQFAAKQT